MGIEQLYLDYNITVAPDNHRHFRDGWINVECPFCTGNPGHHLGFNLDGKYYYCYRCGSHPVNKTLSTLLNVPYEEAKKIAKDYKVYSTETQKAYGAKLDKIGVDEFKLPTNIERLSRKHKHYLFNRGYNPNKLAREFRLKGTGPVSLFRRNRRKGKKSIQTKFRIFIPIYWQGRMVSWTTRDVTGKQQYRYITCPMENEIIHHKFIVYCREGQLPKDVGIWVEGPADVWRVPNSFCAFGITYTQEQLDLIIRNFKCVYIWFDPDPQAVKQAEKIEKILNAENIETAIIKSNQDPADMEQLEVNEFIKQINL